MEITRQISNNSTILNDRVLVYDGDSILNPDEITEMILSGLDISNIYTSEITSDITQYNLSSINSIKTKNSVNEFDYSWNIPEKYKKINVLEYVINKYVKQNKFNQFRYDRIVLEMKIFKSKNLIEFLKTLIFIVDVIETNNIVRGVGRGSSVASYVLYIIGIHSIDSFAYELDFSEFIR